jgi:hypothetical protein
MSFLRLESHIGIRNFRNRRARYTCYTVVLGEVRGMNWTTGLQVEDNSQKEDKARNREVYPLHILQRLGAVIRVFEKYIGS